MPAEPRTFRFSMTVGVLGRDDIKSLTLLINFFVLVLGSLRPEARWSRTNEPDRLSLTLHKNGEVYAQGFMDDGEMPPASSPLSVVKP